MTERKHIHLSELKINSEIRGYENGTATTIGSLVVTDIKNNTVYFNRGEPLKNASGYMFSVDMTEEELREKYKTAIEEIKEALSHDLGQVDGYHEMWNTWLYAKSLATMASELNQHKLRIIGYATLTSPKYSFFGDLLDIGIVAEYSSGERIWCHASNEYRKTLLRRK